MTINDNKIIADDNMILTNGKVYTRRLYLGVNDSSNNWYEITEEEYKASKENENRKENNDEL